MKACCVTLEFVPAQSAHRAAEMCIETLMETPHTHTHTATSCSAKHAFVSKTKWKMLRTTEDSFKTLHKTVRTAAARRCALKGRPAVAARPGGQTPRAGAEEDRSSRTTTRAPGAMAPQNTTQYLMARVYADMPPLGDAFPPRAGYDTAVDVYGESLSPMSVSTALDSIYDDYLAFQQRDFEDVFGL